MNSRSQTLPILYTVILCTLPHMINISIFASLVCISMWGYHLGTIYRGWPVPGLKTRTVLGTVLFVMAVLTHEGLTVEAFVALLSLSIAMKLFELNHQRDGIIAVILCYFIIVSGMFFNDSIIATLYILFTVLFNTAVLIHIQFNGLRLKPAFALSSQLALRGFPFMLILFLLFPRIQGGLWGRPAMIQGTTGFSETLTLGSVASLVQSNKVAFRATFTSPAPSRAQMYWRGLVFWKFDGTTWKRGNRTRGSAKGFDKGTRTVDYSITLEPHNERWLFGLDLPIRLQADRSWLRNDYSPYRWRPVTSRISYTVQSSLGARPQLEQELLASALELPGQGNRRSRQLARQWQNSADSPTEIISLALQFFQENNNFRYTLKPGPVPLSMRTDQIDYFLFSSRQGFCEHFATAFAFLMRAAGVPARLVGGYLGGEQNPLGEYWIIRQSDAHVWVEVLSKDNRWQRIDPTAVVAPDRTSNSMAQVLPEDQQKSLLSYLGLDSLPPWFMQLRNMWDFTNNRWNLWVMEYSISDQTRIFSHLGINISVNKGVIQAIFIAAVLLGAAFFLTLVFLRSQKTEQDMVEDYWLRFCEKMHRAGVARLPNQGPATYSALIQEKRPDLYQQVRHIIDLYIKIRFQPRHSLDDAKQFKQMIQQFSQPKKHEHNT